MTNDQTVTQADREAAAQVYDARPSDWSGASDQVRRGLHDDTAIVQAFARHRTAHSGEGSSNGAGEDALRRSAEKFEEDPNSDPRALAVEIVDGIRGYTCEFAPSQREHEYWYDRVESLAARAALSAPQGELERLREALASIIHANGPVVIDFMGEGIGWRPLDYGTWAQLSTIPIAPILIASRRTWAYAAGRDHSRAVDSRAGGADQHNPHSLNQPYERFCWTLGWEEAIVEDAALAQPEAGGE